MDPDRWKRIEEIYQTALEQPVAERSAFLQRACEGDENLRREIEEMLEARGQAGSFLARPAAEQVGLAESRPTSGALIGKRIGPYEVLSLLGKGGMGEVYRARDTRLDRIDALKILPPEVAADPERLRRFIREARAASALNHPNIAIIYEIGESGGIHWIAMELVEGATLSELLKGKPLELDEILNIGIQVADALEEAHGKGITHRDIKPSNLMINPKGHAKILDFGLAKIARRDGSTLTVDTTETHTQPGLVMGTARYMSPEQVLGQAVDHRTDIFSLGVVLYEMATGKPPFAGETPSAIFDAIVHQAPSWPARVDARIPEELERIINRSLEKFREMRYQGASELGTDLRRLKRDTDPDRAAAIAIATEVARKPIVALKPRALWKWLLAAGFVLAAGGTSWHYYSRLASPPLPQVRPFTSYNGREITPAFSPNGIQVAFAWNGEKQDNFDIYVKNLGPEAPLRLTTSPAYEDSPAWSPDGQYIAYLRRSSDEILDIIRVPALGGPEARLGHTENVYYYSAYLSWSPDGKFIAVVGKDAPQDRGSLFLVSVGTGDRRKIASSSADYLCMLPAFSPDGRTLAYTRGGSGRGDLLLLSIRNGEAVDEPRRLTFNPQQGVLGLDWTPDGRSLIFSSNLTGSWSLWKVPTSGGAPQPGGAGGENVGALSVARNGNRLVYERFVSRASIWRVAGPGPAAGDLTTKEKSPARLISSTRGDTSPRFSLDGRKIAFSSDRSGNWEIWVCDSDGANPRQLTSLGSVSGSPQWSPDGQQIVFDSNADGNWDIYVMRAEGGQPRRLTSESSLDSRPSWSRDGRWINFASDRSGDVQIWKVPSQGGSATQVTKKGGYEAIESTDGKWLYFAKRMPAQGIWRVPVDGGEEVQVLENGLECFFDITKEGIFLLNPLKEGGPNIEFFGFARGRLAEVASLGQGLEFELGSPSFAVSFDGKSILYTAGESESDLILVENFR